jgi:hypothetical protein
MEILRGAFFQEGLFLLETISITFCPMFGVWQTGGNIPMMSTAALERSLPKKLEIKRVRYLRTRIIFGGREVFAQKDIAFLSRRLLALRFASIYLATATFALG